MNKCQSVFLALTGALFLQLDFTAQAQTTRYWDTDGTNPGLGVGGTYDWVFSNLWNTDPTGGAAGVTGGWTDGDTAIFNGNGISTVTMSTTINTTNFAVGSGAADGTAVTLNLSGSGTLNINSNGYWGVGWQAADATTSSNSAVMNLTSGTINISSSIYIGRWGCSGTFNQTGGSVNGVVVTYVGNGAYYPNGLFPASGTLNISNGLFSPLGNLYLPYSSGPAPAVPTVGTMNIGAGGTAVFGTIYVCNSSNTIGTINLNSGGTLLANVITKGPYANGTTNNTIAIFNFNGGVFEGRKTGQPTLGQNGTNGPAFDAVYVQGGGATIDTAGHGLYFTDALLDGGGGGGLTKIDTGNLELDNVNTYTGGTTIEAGQLNLGVYAGYNTNNGSINNSAFINIYPGGVLYVGGRSDNTLPLQSGQILEGGGTISGNLTAHGMVAPGNGMVSNTMSLTVVGRATLAGTTVMNLNRNNGTNSDRLLSTYPITYGGSLIVSNIGDPLVAGDTFTLFSSSGGYVGSFTNIVLPTLTGTNVWNTSSLAVNGSISVGAPSLVKGTPTWTPRYINTTVNGQVAPSGYYEYLPPGYNATPQAQTNFPVIIFMHGSGQYGDGTATGSPGLANNLTDGLCKLIQNNTYPVAQSGGVFDVNNVIVLCPQCANPYPMVDSTWRNFYNFVLAAYPKIDKRRIWFTGLSYGSTTVTTAMDYTQDPSPDDPAAVLAIAWRGDDLNSPVLVPPIAGIGKTVPLWILTAQGDTSSNPDACVNALAAAISGKNNLPSDYSVFPAGNFTMAYTAYFNGTTWALSSQQVDSITGVNPKITYFAGSDHDSWDPTYQNTNSWAWLFQQQKPDVRITSPSSNMISPQGSSLTFTGVASDKKGTALTGSSLIWIDSVNGTLGTGNSITVTNLSIGAHIVKLQATDNSYRDNKITINVTVPYAAAFTALFDFGPTGLNTTGWNDITSTSVSTVTDAVATNGTPIGINLAIASPFVGTQNGGVPASNLYPLTAQENTLYVGGAGSAQTAQLLVSGLNPAETYNFEFFASRDTSDDRTSTYTINGNTVSLQAAGNTSNIVSINGIKPNSSGQVTITIGHGPNATYGYLGVLTITTAGAAPLPPPQLAVSVSAQQMVLSWPQGATNYLLQTTTNLAPGTAWVDVSNAASLMGQFIIPLPVTGPQAFFRLHSQ